MDAREVGIRVRVVRVKLQCFLPAPDRSIVFATLRETLRDVVVGNGGIFGDLAASVEGDFRFVVLT